MKVNWQNFKNVIDSRGLSVQWLNINNYYYLKAIDGLFSLECELDKNPSDTTDLVDFETNYKPYGNQKIDHSNSPFADKNIGSKKLFRRKHGFKQTITASSTEEITFSVPYTQAKITKAEIINCKAGDTVDLTIHDDATGTYTTVPNYQLNKFGFGVVMPDGIYVDKSDYDADLYNGMVIKITYTNTDTVNKEIGINITLHEVV